MLRPGLLLPALLLVACGTSSDSSQTDPDTSAASEDASTAANTVADTTDDTTAAATDDTGTSDTPTTGASAGYCNGWQDGDGDIALSLFDKDNKPLMDGSTLPLECGGQGLFMFGLYPTFGGFTPESDNIDFTIEVDVDGFNTNPDGHFYSADPVGYYIGCEQLDGGVSGVVPIFPLDNLTDLESLDGLFAGVHVVLHTPNGDIVRDLQVKLAVTKDDSWTFCGG